MNSKALLLVIGFFVLISGGFVGASMQPSEVEEWNNKATEILVGEVLSVQTISTNTCSENRSFEFEIKRILISESDLEEGDKINVPFLYNIDTIECAVAGGNYADVSVGDLIKIYASEEDLVYNLMLGGYSIVELDGLDDSGTTGCIGLYWFDNDNKECSQKEFCGAYMYYGLQTFDTEEECESALVETNCKKAGEFCGGVVPEFCCEGLQCYDDEGEPAPSGTCSKDKSAKVCAQDTKRCPDGSYVSRNSEENCKFDECKRNRGNITFTPWQKRNESECVVGCKCVGAVMSCPTESGKIMTITAGRSGNVIVITVDKTEVNTTLEVEIENDTENKTRLRAKMSNGRKAEIKIMPSTASERARERLGELGFNITLKEVGDKVVYELDGEKEAKILGMFKTRARVTAEVDAENGEVVRVRKPWWSFAASGI
ncbi:PepSY domain-containing protein [Candidatus Pacearchaeota archaeon]|nr:PepSY domain-containing protein [Candidatus Pacearchaeota archaeon]